MSTISPPFAGDATFALASSSEALPTATNWADLLTGTQGLLQDLRTGQVTFGSAGASARFSATNPDQGAVLFKTATGTPVLPPKLPSAASASGSALPRTLPTRPTAFVPTTVLPSIAGQSFALGGRPFVPLAKALEDAVAGISDGGASQAAWLQAGEPAAAGGFGVAPSGSGFPDAATSVSKRVAASGLEAAVSAFAEKDAAPTESADRETWLASATPMLGSAGSKATRPERVIVLDYVGAGQPGEAARLAELKQEASTSKGMGRIVRTGTGVSSLGQLVADVQTRRPAGQAFSKIVINMHGGLPYAAGRPANETFKGLVSGLIGSRSLALGTAAQPSELVILGCAAPNTIGDLEGLRDYLKALPGEKNLKITFSIGEATSGDRSTFLTLDSQGRLSGPALPLYENILRKFKQYDFELAAEFAAYNIARSISKATDQEFVWDYPMVSSETRGLPTQDLWRHANSLVPGDYSQPLMSKTLRNFYEAKSLESIPSAKAVHDKLLYPSGVGPVSQAVATFYKRVREITKACYPDAEAYLRKMER